MRSSGRHGAGEGTHILQSALVVVAGWAMVFMVFESVEILVSFSACVTFEWFMFFHAKGSRVWAQSFGIDDGECTVFVGVELLGIVAMLKLVSQLSRQIDVRVKAPTYCFMIFQSILVLVRLLTPNDRAVERLWYSIIWARSSVWYTRHPLLLSNGPSQLTIFAIWYIT